MNKRPSLAGWSLGIFSPRSGREHLAQGKSAEPWVSMSPVILSPRSGRRHLGQGKSA